MMVRVGRLAAGRQQELARFPYFVNVAIPTPQTCGRNTIFFFFFFFFFITPQSRVGFRADLRPVEEMDSQTSGLRMLGVENAEGFGVANSRPGGEMARELLHHRHSHWRALQIPFLLPLFGFEVADLRPGGEMARSAPTSALSLSRILSP